MTPMDWDRPPNKGSGPGNVQDLEEVIRRFKGRFDFSSMSRGPVLLIGLLVVALLVAINSYYTVQPEETAVVQRFGQFVRTADAGLHFKIPFGVEKVTKVVTGRVMQREYGYRTITPGVRSRFTKKGYEDESTMLSGDLNVVDIQWTVQYKIQSPQDYLFRVEDVVATLDDISESVMRRTIGNRTADVILTVGRAAIGDLARLESQQIIDSYKTGLQIITVKLQNANPPEAVKGAFNEVNEARQEKERVINEAQEVFNEKIPKARGQARQQISQAEGYAMEKVNRANGDADRFSSILAEYEKAPDITRRRLYLEAISEFTKRVDRMIVLDGEQSGILPFLNLNQTGGGGPLPFDTDQAKPLSGSQTDGGKQ